MYRNSLDAIRSLLAKSFPDITTIYVDAVPADFVQPSFFVDHIMSDLVDLNRTMVQFDVQWQIVYFPPLKKSGIPDKMNAYATADQLRAVLAAEPYVTAPDGTVFRVMDITGGPRDDELYMSVRLQAQLNRTLPDYDLMQDIHIKEG
jgi:hypothetical protein